MGTKINLFNRSQNYFWGLVVSISMATLFFMVNQNSFAAECDNDPTCNPECQEGDDTRFCYCHKTGSPDDPSGYQDNCSDCNSRSGHCCHGDKGGMCNACGNGIRECCTYMMVDGVQVFDECCNIEEHGLENCLVMVPGCTPEECDDGDNDCRTGNCDANCHISDCNGEGPCCNDGEDCTTDTCITAGKDAGACDFDPLADNSPCEIPGIPECASQRCESAQCIADLSGCPCLEDADCEDMNECTMDSCEENENNMCSNLPVMNGTDCNDGNPNTTFDQCEGGVCVSCGNGQKDNFEECDYISEGVSEGCNEGTTCNPSNCVCAKCGNGIILKPDEECEFDLETGEPIEIDPDTGLPACGEDSFCAPVGSENECTCVEPGSPQQPPETPERNVEGSGANGCSLIQNNLTVQNLTLLFLLGFITVGMVFWKIKRARNLK